MNEFEHSYPRPRHHPRAWPLIKLLVFAALLVSTYGASLLSLKQKLLGGPGPTATVVIQLKWGADYILGRAPTQIKSLFAFPIYYPYQNSFVLSDTMLGNQPI